MESSRDKPRNQEAREEKAGDSTQTLPEMFGVKVCGFLLCQAASRSSRGSWDVSANFFSASNFFAGQSTTVWQNALLATEASQCRGGIGHDKDRLRWADRFSTRLYKLTPEGAGPDECLTISSAGISCSLPWGSAELQSSCRTSAAICPGKSR